MKMLAHFLAFKLAAAGETIIIYSFTSCLAIAALIGPILFFCVNLVNSRKE